MGDLEKRDFQKACFLKKKKFSQKKSFFPQKFMIFFSLRREKGECIKTSQVI